MSAHVLGIDVGTSSCRAELFRAPELTSVGIVAAEWSPVAGPAPGALDVDTDALWELICSCVRRLLERTGVPARGIAAVACSSFGGGLVLYDGAERAIWACGNGDARAAEQAAALAAGPDAGWLQQTSGDGLGISAVPRLRWLREHDPRTFARVRRLSGIADFVALRLTGRLVTEPSLGSTSGLFDVAQRSWSGRILELCGLPAATAPEVVPSGAAIGGVSATGALDAGLAAGTPVVAGGWDTALGQLGIGLTDQHRLGVIAGTFWKNSVLTDRPTIDPEGRLRTMCHVLPQRWTVEGIGFYCGYAMRWFRDAFCDAEVAAAARGDGDAYALMEQLAARTTPGAGGVIGLFSNAMNARDWRHATAGFLQFDLTDPGRSGRKECIRAIEESAAYVTRAHLELLRELVAVDVAEVVMSGGGAKGTLWPQIVADVLGLPVRISSTTEASAFGAAVLGAWGVGIFATIEEAVPRADGGRTCAPDAGRSSTYDALYEQWRSVYAGALELTRTTGLRPMWRAPGT